jgi:hypothetical protein
MTAIADTIDANGSIITESIGIQAKAVGRLHSTKFDPKMTANMSYVQRIMGDFTGCLKMAVFTLDDGPDSAIRFTFAGCIVVEDNHVAHDSIEFRDPEGKTLSRIVNLCTQLPRATYE